jgi:hypothetical protein
LIIKCEVLLDLFFITSADLKKPAVLVAGPSWISSLPWAFAGELHSPHAAGVDLQKLAVLLQVRGGTAHGDAHSNGMWSLGPWSRQPNPRWC